VGQELKTVRNWGEESKRFWKKGIYKLGGKTTGEKKEDRSAKLVKEGAQRAGLEETAGGISKIVRR